MLIASDEILKEGCLETLKKEKRKTESFIQKHPGKKEVNKEFERIANGDNTRE